MNPHYVSYLFIQRGEKSLGAGGTVHTEKCQVTFEPSCIFWCKFLRTKKVLNFLLRVTWRWMSSGMLCDVVEQVSPDVSKDRNAFILRVKQSISVFLDSLFLMMYAVLYLQRSQTTDSRVSCCRRLSSSATPLSEPLNITLAQVIWSNFWG
jgi:hypothetical protein